MIDALIIKEATEAPCRPQEPPKASPPVDPIGEMIVLGRLDEALKLASKDQNEPLMRKIAAMMIRSNGSRVIGYGWRVQGEIEPRAFRIVQPLARGGFHTFIDLPLLIKWSGVLSAAQRTCQIRILDGNNRYLDLNVPCRVLNGDVMVSFLTKIMNDALDHLRAVSRAEDYAFDEAKEVIEWADNMIVDEMMMQFVTKQPYYSRQAAALTGALAHYVGSVKRLARMIGPLQPESLDLCMRAASSVASEMMPSTQEATKRFYRIFALECLSD